MLGLQSNVRIATGLACALPDSVWGWWPHHDVPGDLAHDCPADHDAYYLLLHGGLLPSSPLASVRVRIRLRGAARCPTSQCGSTFGCISGVFLMSVRLILLPNAWSA